MPDPLKYISPVKQFADTVGRIFRFKTAHQAYQIRSGEQLLKHENVVALIQEIHRISGLSESSFDLLYRSALHNFAEFVQLLPASEHHHHHNQGGMLTHTLESVLHTLRIGKSRQLPTGESPEVIRQKSDVYTYALFAGALIHDIGKPVVDMTVQLFTKQGRLLQQWQPFEGPMNTLAGARTYSVEHRKDRRYRLHGKVAPLLASQILPKEGLNWLLSDMTLFEIFVSTLSGDSEGAGELGEIVSMGDQMSVAKNLGSDTAGPSDQNSGLSNAPLQEKIRQYMKLAIADDSTVLNGSGSMGWYDGEYCWVLSKLFVDQVKNLMDSDNIRGAPSDNSRMFDVMGEHGLIERNSSDKAIWRIKISSDSWNPSNEFTALKIPKSKLWNPGSEPNRFEGKINCITGTKAGNTKAEDTDKPATITPESSAGDAAVVEAEPPKSSTPDLGLAGLFLSDTLEPPAVDYGAQDQASLTPSPAETDTTAYETGATAFGDEDHPGTRFLMWLRQSIKAGTLRYNSSHYPVHIIKEGVFLVSPIVFKHYAEKQNQDWQKVQRSFQSLKLNVKNNKGENWHQVRVEGKRQIAMLKGWIIPTEEVFDSGQTPLINDRLKLLSN